MIPHYLHFSRIVPTQNMFNVVSNDKVTSHFSDAEIHKHSHLMAA